MNQKALTASEIDDLLHEYKELGEKAKTIKELRRSIAKRFDCGRTEGTTLAIYREQDTVFRNQIDINKLRHYVTKDVLAMCSVTRRKSGVTRLVPKLKPRKKKEA